MPIIERLEDRRVPAALPPDMALVSASSAECQSVMIDHNKDNINVNGKFKN
jgi:hypothetical protein